MTLDVTLPLLPSPVFRFRNNPNFLWVFARENYKLGFYTHSKAHDHRAKMHYQDATRTPAYKNKNKVQ